MDVNSIVSLGLIGAAFGGLLAFAAQKFSVETDPKLDEVLAALPGANCGACGFPGCAGLAEAIVSGEAKVGTCPVGGPTVAAVIGGIMGLVNPSDGLDHRQVAHVYCQKNCDTRGSYEGIQSCRAATSIASGTESCLWACVGLGDCVHVCPFGAISISSKGVAVIDEDKCQSCGLCAKTCPKRIIGLVPDHWTLHVDCSSQDRGVAVRKTGCETGCLACGACERACPFQAIHVMRNNETSEQIGKTRAVTSLAVIDYDLCRECGLCEAACPTHAIRAQLGKTVSKATIGSGCVGCHLCVSACPMHAISGETGGLHSVNQELCIGCGLCIDKCPKHAIDRLAPVPANNRI